LRRRSYPGSIGDLGFDPLEYELVRADGAIAGLFRAEDRILEPDSNRRSDVVVDRHGGERIVHRDERAKLKLGPALLTDTSTFQGFVTSAGQITMQFTPTSGGAVTVGLGHMRSVNGVTGNGVTGMEMQMITGDSLLVTHWACMLRYDPATFTPPAPQPVPANSVPQWAWTSGTPWRIVSPALFGTATPGRFVITNYQNGYFWHGHRARRKWRRHVHLAGVGDARRQCPVQHAVARHARQPLRSSQR
jgi:hypothetical protein